MRDTGTGIGCCLSGAAHAATTPAFTPAGGHVMAASKYWLRSRTILINLAVAVLAVAIDNLHLLGPVMSPRAFAAVAYGLPILNVALRVLTHQPLTLRANQREQP